MGKKLSIVIVHWNTPELLEKQLSKLAIGNENKIIVVENNSSEKITFKNKFPNVTFIENKINRGFAFACNQGGTKAVGEWLLFLNPDVAIDNEQIKQLIDWAEKNNCIACSPQPQSDNYRKPVPTVISLLAEFTPLSFWGSRRNVGRLQNRFWTPSNGAGKHSRVRLGQNDYINARVTLTGGCLLIKRDIFKKLGGFDERFFLWFEDSDLTKRLLDNNYKYGFAPIGIKHSGGVSIKKNDEQSNRHIFFNSMAIYAKKHFSPFGQFVVSLIKKKYSKRNLLPEINNGVTITVPNVNKNLLSKFLDTNYSFFKESDEYSVVTSGIDESEVWQWRKKYKQVRFIPITKNDGFSATVNIGFRVSTGKYIGTVNDDTVLNANWIGKCLQCTDDKTGSVNPVINKPDGTIESAGIDLLPYGKAIPITSLKDRHPELVSEPVPNLFRESSSNEMPKQVRHDSSSDCFETDATNAAAVLYSNEALNKAGLFDETFGSYLEDIDLSLRIKRAGYKNTVCTSASIIHMGQQTSKSIGSHKNWLDFKNWILVILKNWSIVELTTNLPQIIIERIRNISGIIKSS